MSINYLVLTMFIHVHIRAPFTSLLVVHYNFHSFQDSFVPETHTVTQEVRLQETQTYIGSVFISFLAILFLSLLWMGSRSLNTLAAAGGNILLGYLAMAASRISQSPWIGREVT